jgi:hypothetical protein
MWCGIKKYASAATISGTTVITITVMISVVTITPVE